MSLTVSELIRALSSSTIPRDAEVKIIDGKGYIIPIGGILDFPGDIPVEIENGTGEHHLYISRGLKLPTYQVFDNGKPADCYGIPIVHESWDCSTFNSFEEALCYARKWIGPYAGGSADGKNGVILEENTPWDYSGMGDFIEIRKIEE